MAAAEVDETSVSRETIDPALVHSLFGTGHLLIYQFVDLLTDVGVVRGLLGPREVGRVWSRHVVNCAVVDVALPRGSSVADVGSGAGLPGLVFAIARPDLHLTLVEPLLRRSSFLLEVVGALGLGNVEVVRTRAEDFERRRSFDAVTSRAVAPLDRLVSWCWPLVRVGGAIVAIKGSSASREVEENKDELRRQGLRATVEQYGDGLVDVPTTVVRIQSRRDGEER